MEKVGRGVKRKGTHAHSKLTTSPSITAEAWEWHRGGKGGENIYRPFLPLPSSPLGAGQAALGGRTRWDEERHHTQAAASVMSWSLWAWACPTHGNEQRMCMCRLREAHPQGPGKDNQVSCLLSYTRCQSFCRFHGNWLLQKWCYENYFRDLKLTDLLCSNGSRETQHCIALRGVWKRFQRSVRYPMTACTTCPVSLTACAAPNPSQGRRRRRWRRWKRKEQRLQIPLAPYQWVQLTAAQEAVLLPSLGAEIYCLPCKVQASIKPADAPAMCWACGEISRRLQGDHAAAPWVEMVKAAMVA